MKHIALSLVLLLTLFVAAGCANDIEEKKVNGKGGELNVYSSRHYDVDQDLFDQFEKETGIKVNVIDGDGKSLIERLYREKNNPQADLYLEVGAGTLAESIENGLIEDHQATDLTADVMEGFYGDSWIALTKRARAMAYDTDVNDDIAVKRYTDLAQADFKDAVLVRSSTNEYNIALVSALIQNYGLEEAKVFVDGIVNNMAREPEGNDRDQAKAMVEGLGDVSIMSTYYVQKLRISSDPKEVEVGKRLGVTFPEETFADISWMGIVNGANNRDHALTFMAFLLTEESQTAMMAENGELPTNEQVDIIPALQSLSGFNLMPINYETLGNNRLQAIMLMDEAGWK